MAAVVRTLGIDIGSVAVKLVMIEGTTPVRRIYRRFHGGPLQTLFELLSTDLADLLREPCRIGLTGISAKTAAPLVGGETFGEIASIAAGVFQVAPDARTVIEMGGEDSKFLSLDPQRRLVTEFSMNAQCAAGTGSFLDQQAGRLKISIEEEFGRMALRSTHPPRIAGRCSVFAKSDMIHLQQIATPDYDIVAGLCFAVARNYKSAIARGRRFEAPVVFVGGVAANPGVLRAFRDVLQLDESQLTVPPDFNLVGALGAAALADQRGFEPRLLLLDKLEAYLAFRSTAETEREALSFDYPDTKHYHITRRPPETVAPGHEVFLGIDIGSLSTNLVLIDTDDQVIARRYLMTEGRPIEAVRRGLREIEAEIGDKVLVRAVGTTGSGRYLVGDLVGADIVRNEITAQATAAIAIDPDVDTIFEIGGQDSKYIAITDGAVVDFEMNKACAAGTGSFLQEQAEKLDINIEEEFAELAMCGRCPVGCGERCTVFMESDLVGHQRTGAQKEDLLAGLAYSIASNYLTRVVGDRRIGNHIFFQGGVAWNKAVVAAFEKLVGKPITIPPHHDVTGAIGAAMLAREQARTPGFSTRFKGFAFYERHYDMETVHCTDCANQCEIRKVVVEGELPLYYGARCEKFDVERKSESALPVDYARQRQRLLYRQYIKPSTPRTRGTVGLPRVLHFFEYYPFWRAFFETAGYEVVNSDLSGQRIVEESLELFAAETCYPIKIVFGHVANLVQKKVDTIFLPALIRVKEPHEEGEGAHICPYVQTVGSQVKARFDFEQEGVRFVNSPINLCQDSRELRRNLRTVARDFGLGDAQYRRAVDAALRAYRSYKSEVRRLGRQALEALAPDDTALVVVSRPYNGYDARLSLELPDKIRNLGVTALPMDLLDLSGGDDTPFMYWRYGRNILAAADYIRNHPNLFAVYITSFGCGPDSFISHFFRRNMRGKPYLQVELDEHSADAGLITRCEAFLDSLRHYRFKPSLDRFSVAVDSFRPFERTIYIPPMCDHAFALKAAFERFGLTAEVLPESDNLTLDFGKRFTSGKECFPCIVTTGDMFKKIHSEGFDPDKSVFFMPGATGPCRFGLYSQFHRMVLDDLGHGDIPIFSPNSGDGYKDFGLDGTAFRRIAWKGVVAVDCLIKALHWIRPYEITPGESERVYRSALERLEETIRTDAPIERFADSIAREFAAIPVARTARPLVGVVGEIYLRNNRFSNNFLIEKLEKLGLEVWLAGFAEWPLYTSTTYQRDSWKALDWRGILVSSLQILIQQRQEHAIVKCFERHLDLPSDFHVARVLELASDYIPLDCKGEAILSIGKSIEMAGKGACGIVNAMPFNCMPGTVVSSISPKLSGQLGGIPWLNISYEGLRDSGEDTRLEAFAEQVRSYWTNAAGRSTPAPTVTDIG